MAFQSSFNALIGREDLCCRSNECGDDRCRLWCRKKVDLLIQRCLNLLSSPSIVSAQGELVFQRRAKRAPHRVTCHNGRARLIAAE